MFSDLRLQCSVGASRVFWSLLGGSVGGLLCFFFFIMTKKISIRPYRVSAFLVLHSEGYILAFAEPGAKSDPPLEATFETPLETPLAALTGGKVRLTPLRCFPEIAVVGNPHF